MYGSWPMMGYDAKNNYQNTAEKILTLATAPMLKEKWRAKVAGFPPGTPVVAGGRVFVQAPGGTYAISLLDGKILWQRDDLAGTSSMAYADGFVYVHTNPADLYRLNPVDGKTVWGPVRTWATKDCDGESSPIVANGMVFVGHSCGPVEIGSADFTGALGGVEAFDVNTGKPLWTYLTVPKTGENGAMVWSTVTVDVDNKTLFAGTGNNYSVQGENSDSIHAVDLMTGTRLWKKQVHNNDTWSLFGAPTGPDTDFGGNPILADIDGMQVVADGTKGSSFHVMDRKTGNMVWERSDLSTSHSPSNGGVLMNGAYDGKNFYVVSNQPPGAAVLHAMDKKTGKDVWPALNLPKLTWGAPSLANDVLIVPSDDEILVMNALTGMMIAKFATGGTIAAGAPAIVDGNVVVGSGLMYDLDASAKPNNEIVCYAVPGAMAPDLSGTGPVTMMPTFVPGSPTWSAIWQEIIVTKGCNGGPSCHAASAGGNLVMQTKDATYAALIDVKAMGVSAGGGASCSTTNMMRVTANDPTNSLLLNKVEQAMPVCGSRMPPGGMLTAAEIKQIRDWIMAGAKND
jgi:outer membrane protein assembly factor BamB